MHLPKRKPEVEVFHDAHELNVDGELLLLLHFNGPEADVLLRHAHAPDVDTHAPRDQDGAHNVRPDGRPSEPLPTTHRFYRPR